MEVKILIAIIVLLVLIMIVYGVMLYRRKRDTVVISIKEHLATAKMPIITFSQGGDELHLFLDSGSNMSYLHSGLVDLSLLEDANTLTISGFEGVETTGKMCTMYFNYKDTVFVENFGVIDLSYAMATIQKHTGVMVHGFVGSDFFLNYKMILDYEKQVVTYRKSHATHQLKSVL